MKIIESITNWVNGKQVSNTTKTEEITTTVSSGIANDPVYNNHYRFLNNKSIGSGYINTVDLSMLWYPVSFSAFGGLTGGSGLAYNLITSLQQWNEQRWIYEGLPDEIRKSTLEWYLFLWGRCCIWKDKKGVLLVTPFVGEKYDYNGYEIEVRPIIVSVEGEKTVKTPLLKVGEDCALIYSTAGYLFLKKSIFGPLWRVLHLINDVTFNYYLTQKNMCALNQKIPVSKSVTEQEVNNLNQMFKSPTDIFVRMNENALNETFLTKKGGDTSQNILSLQDNSTSLWQGLENTLDWLKRMIGMSSNSNAQKKERQINSEININNVISDGINRSELERREEGINQVNKVFSLNITVKLKEEEQQMEEEKKEEEMMKNNEEKENDVKV